MACNLYFPSLLLNSIDSWAFFVVGCWGPSNVESCGLHPMVIWGKEKGATALHGFLFRSSYRSRCVFQIMAQQFVQGWRQWFVYLQI